MCGRITLTVIHFNLCQKSPFNPPARFEELVNALGDDTLVAAASKNLASKEVEGTQTIDNV